MLTATVVMTAIGLAMDAVAVSIASGLAAQPLRQRDALKLAFIFGAFQAVMPALGFLLGFSVTDWVATWGTWIAFIVLLALGINMLIGALSKNEIESDLQQNPMQHKKIMVLGFATSIDAFAVGVSFSFIDTGLVVTCATIGIITALLCYSACWYASKLGSKFAKHAEIFGGVVLISIGCKILPAHYW